MRPVILDCNYLCHVAKYAFPSLSHEGQPTGVIYGFLKSVLDLSKQFKSGFFLFCWDSNISLRKEIYPGYKDRENKNETSEEKEAREGASYQFELLRREILPYIGFKNNFHKKGYESDDIIASVVLTLHKLNGNEKSVVVSSDKDLYQLLSYCDMYSPAKKQVMTEEAFKTEFGVSPDLWAEAKSIAGCSTDTVAGVEGVKEKTAIKYLVGQLKRGTVAFNRIAGEEGRAIAERNRPLVALPFEGTGTFPIHKTEFISASNFLFMCEKYGLHSFMRQPLINEWYSNFHMGNR